MLLFLPLSMKAVPTAFRQKKSIGLKIICIEMAQEIFS
jgi:hypothetical protein